MCCLVVQWQDRTARATRQTYMLWCNCCRAKDFALALVAPMRDQVFLLPRRNGISIWARTVSRIHHQSPARTIYRSHATQLHPPLNYWSAPPRHCATDAPAFTLARPLHLYTTRLTTRGKRTARTCVWRNRRRACCLWE